MLLVLLVLLAAADVSEVGEGRETALPVLTSSPTLMTSGDTVFPCQPLFC